MTGVDRGGGKRLPSNQKSAIPLKVAGIEVGAGDGRARRRALQRHDGRRLFGDTDPGKLGGMEFAFDRMNGLGVEARRHQAGGTLSVGARIR